MRPITPQEVAKKKEATIPKFVLDAFDALIAEHYFDGRSVVLLKEVRERVGQVCKSEWFNVEDTYRAAGWKVEYDQPGYNESYPAKFTFIAQERKTV